MRMRRRPLLGAAVVGGVAYHTGKKGQQSREQEADQNAQIADLQAQHAAVPAGPRGRRRGGSRRQTKTDGQADATQEPARPGRSHPG